MSFPRNIVSNTPSEHETHECYKSANPFTESVNTAERSRWERIREEEDQKVCACSRQHSVNFCANPILGLTASVEDKI